MSQQMYAQVLTIKYKQRRGMEKNGIRIQGPRRKVVE